MNEMSSSGWEISSNVPQPPNRGRLKYPWPFMEAGQSVYIECPDDGPQPNSVRSSAMHWVKRNRPDLVVSAMKEDNGVRVWFYKKGEER